MMKRSPEEIAALRESFRKMDTPHKIEHIYTYYKWFILLGLIALWILGSGVHRQLTKKEPVLYLGLVNVSVGTEMEQALTLVFLEAQGLNPKKTEVLVYKGMYLSDDPASENHQYAYATRMKIMATITAQELDVVLMNQEAYDLLSHSGYLMELTGLSKPLAPFLTQNEVVVEDNYIDVQLNNETERRYATQLSVNAVDVSQFPLFRDAGFDGTVYAGVIGNTPRLDTVLAYLEGLH